jgi:hypothetical protein
MTPWEAADWLEAAGKAVDGDTGELRFVVGDLRVGCTGDVKRLAKCWARESRVIRTWPGKKHVRAHRQLTLLLRRLLRLVEVPHKGQVYRDRKGHVAVVDCHRGCMVYYRSYSYGFPKWPEMGVRDFMTTMTPSELRPEELEQLGKPRGLPDDN